MFDFDDFDHLGEEAQAKIMKHLARLELAAGIAAGLFIAAALVKVAALFLWFFK
jgi:hypothetical protein